MVAASILDFQICQILLADGVWRAQTHHCAKYCQNRSIGCEDIKIFPCFKISWICFGHIWTTNSEYLGVSTLYHSAKFGYDQCCSFYNTNISIFGPFGWKMPIHVPKIGVFGQFDPLNGLQYKPKPKKARPCVSPRHLSH